MESENRERAEKNDRSMLDGWFKKLITENVKHIIFTWTNNIYDIIKKDNLNSLANEEYL